MKIYNKAVLSILGSVLIVGTGSAQNWTINGLPQSTQLTSSATEAAVAIDPATGVATVKTAGAGPSVSISANPTSVLTNATTSITWNASGFGGNLNCTRTSSPSGLTGWSSTSNTATGSTSVTMPATAQTVTISLSCTGDNGSANSFTSVSVTQPGTGGVDCTQRRPGYNGSPRQEVRRSYFSIFNAGFPGPINARWEGQPSGVADGAVIALEFVAPTSPAQGYMDIVDSPDRGGFGRVTAGFSDCPGEISTFVPGSTTVLNPCWGGELKTLSRWTLDPGDVNRCVLIPGKTYFLNITMVERCLSSGGAPANCGLRMEVR